MWFLEEPSWRHVVSLFSIGGLEFSGIQKPKPTQEAASYLGTLDFLVFWVAKKYIHTYICKKKKFFFLVWHGLLGFGKLETLMLLTPFRKLEVFLFLSCSCVFASRWSLLGLLYGESGRRSPYLKRFLRAEWGAWEFFRGMLRFIWWNWLLLSLLCANVSFAAQSILHRLLTFSEYRVKVFFTWN